MTLRAQGSNGGGPLGRRHCSPRWLAATRRADPATRGRKRFRLGPGVPVVGYQLEFDAYRRVADLVDAFDAERVL